MADFIDIKNGISVNMDNIEAIIESNKDGKTSCKVYISGVSYPSDISKSELLYRINGKGVKRGKTVQEQVLNIMKQQSNFAG